MKAGLALLGAIALVDICLNGIAVAASRSGVVRSAAPAVAKLYVSTSSQIIGYRIESNGHAAQICTVPYQAGEGYSDVAVDKDGRLLEPTNEGGDGVRIFRAGGMCGPQIGGVSREWDGYPVDAASLNASTGKIVFASVQPFSLNGGVFVCRLGGSCSELYTGQPSYAIVAISVAIDSSGDCWAVVPFYSSSAYHYSLEYFRGCRHSGVVASGWVNPFGGGLDVDIQGNLLSISSPTYNGGSEPSTLYVYRGCKPACKRIGGPFVLGHGATYGHASRDGTMFASTGEGFIDLYSYRPTSLKPAITVNTGATQSYGVTFSPGR